MYAFKIPETLKKMNKVFEENGYKSYLVGGAVRDMIMGIAPHDYDLTTNATPQEVMRIFKKVIPTGIDHGTVTVHFMNEEIEVTTFRTESDYSDGRHPDSVNFASTIEEDLSRRDFTMNAIAINLKDNSIVDPFDGQKDIKKRIIRTVGNPLERFDEDGLRPVRAIRFCSQLDFDIEEKTYSALSNLEVLKKTSMVSVERFRDELLKLLKSDKPSKALRIMEETGILDIFIPEFKVCRGCIQNDDRGYHVFDVMDHNLYACDGAPKEKMIVRVAALFHDIGKPQVRVERINEQGLHVTNFYQHENASEKITRKVLTKLKFSNLEIEKICHLVSNHMFHYESSWGNPAVRRFIVKIGLENVEDLIDLRLADMYGKYNQDVRIHDNEACLKLIELQERIKKISEEKNALSLKSLAVNGKDLINEGIPAGKFLGQILNELFETVLDDPEMNEKEKLIHLARNLWNSRSGE